MRQGKREKLTGLSLTERSRFAYLRDDAARSLHR